MRLRVVVSLSLLSLAAAGNASALTQPNGATIPSPMGCSGGEPTGLLPVMACACTAPGVCNIGAPCPGGSTSCDNGEHGTCETTLWHSPNDNSCIPSNQSGLNPATAAQILPETFHPTCGQTFTVLSRGTAEFQDIFGWYNATTTGTAPDPTDLHVMLTCGDAAGASVTLNVQSDPSYLGGDIGFFLITPESHSSPSTCASGNCCPSVALLQSGVGYIYYSQREFDPDPGYIHLLNLPGTIEPNRFYFAWEDTFQTTSADFTDLVATVDGVQCSGAGVACNTGADGVCAQGITECASGATTPTCTGVVQPQPETCDGLDDNCDGIVDNGATCPITGDICVNGQCVAHCGSAENPCSQPLACDQATGECVDPKCIGVTCSADQVCNGGTCVTACQGVVCPQGQTCVGDACLDLCARVSCAGGEVCVEGVCLPSCISCGGLTCSAPLSCDSTSGACIDLSCPTPCAAGTVCQAGTCVDACQGVVCPAGGTCTAGECSTPGASGDDGGIGLVSPGGTSSGGGQTGAGSDGGGGNGGSYYTSGPASGCACSTLSAKSDADRTEYAGAFFAALGIGGVMSRRRRRRAAS
jgi:MYXO-CTERM domain-containing protein